MNSFEIFACPRCESKLEAAGSESLQSLGCGASYPVRNGIPMLLATGANDVSYEKFSQTPTESVEYYEEFYKGHYDYKRFNSADQFAKVEGYVFLRPLSMFLGGAVLSKPVTRLTEWVMRLSPKTFTARIVVIGKKK
ncbi:MAG: hypothetical protein KIS88_10570 [Anaerolineales bacterium]|nr:hypothetical protein [Anaerolineales bacterium]